MQDSTRKGQILIIVLIMIMIIAIVIVSVSNNLIKNNQLTSQDARYNTLQAMAEDLSIQFGMEYGNPGNSERVEVFNEDTFTDFVSNIDYEIIQEAGVNKCQNTLKEGKFSCYQCEIQRKNITGEENSAINSEAIIRGVLSACDTPLIENAEVRKDEILVFDLQGSDNAQTKQGVYTLSIQKNSIKPASASLAIEVAIDFNYTDSSGKDQISSVKRIIDYNNLFPTVNSNIENTRYIPITVDNSNTEYIKYIFDINSVINNIANNANQGYLSHLLPDGSTINVTKINQIRLKPYMKPNSAEPGDGSVKLSIETMNAYINITQGRRIEANIYEVSSVTGEVIGSQALVVSTVPAIIYPTIFDYVMKTNSLSN
jgi:hypothetical protein